MIYLHCVAFGAVYSRVLSMYVEAPIFVQLFLC